MEKFEHESFGERETDYEGIGGYRPVGGQRAMRLLNRDLRDDRRRKEGRPSHRCKRRYYNEDELRSGAWLYVVDNKFALRLSKTIDQWETLQQQSYTTKLCQDCKIYAALCQLPKTTWLSEIEQLTINLVDLRKSKSSKTHNEYLQIGLPILPDPGSFSHFAIMREWLRVCDNHKDHKGYGCRSETESVLPTRVLDVKRRTFTKSIRLYCSERGEIGDYIALSHCWGDVEPEGRATFCSVKRNIKQRRRGINIDELPKTFRDAIRVTRGLGKRYLWIDSLCIVQDDPEDWEREAKTMELVYNGAYCTIAATSAKNSLDGFLGPRRQRRFVKISPPARPASTDSDDIRRHFELINREVWRTVDGMGNVIDEQESSDPEPEEPPSTLYICEHIDDFTRDVEDSVLNSRGWVLQERALSRRILHFSDTQTYWECGVGVHCETLTLMYNSKTHLLGDPKFPSNISLRTYAAALSAFESLCCKYMELNLTQATDRAIAFSGLEKRLADNYSNKVRFGIFGKFLHRTLLWERDGKAPLKRTVPKDRSKRTAPSWSWMAYEGKINYMSINAEQVDWSQAIQFPVEEMLECTVRDLKNCTIEKKDEVFAVFDRGEGVARKDSDDDREKGWLRFDVEDFDNKSLKCVVVGRDTTFNQSSDNIRGSCYVMVVKLRRGRKYKRCYGTVNEVLLRTLFRIEWLQKFGMHNEELLLLLQLLPSALVTDDTQLCERCSKLQLPSLFGTLNTKPTLSLPPNIVWDYQELRRQEKCVFCQLILRTFQLNPTSHSFGGDQLAAKFETFAQRGILPGFGCRVWVVGLAAGDDETRVTWSDLKSDYGYCIQPAAQDDGFIWPETPSLQARLVDRKLVDLHLVKSWLDLCHGCHSDDCASGQSTAPRQFDFRVIDVVHERIVSAPDNCTYVALSYVWGDAKQVMNKESIRSTLTTPGGMRSLEIPRTIQDAIGLCRELGKDYLWVDALCIHQDDGVDVKSQIANMDQVYSCADITIIAAAGDHCNTGLPGFNGSRNFIQHAANIGGTRFITTQRSPTSTAAKSKWNTRGWTFQENLLSKRLLVFTDMEVFFRCSTSLWCEDVSAECRKSPIRLSDGDWLNRQVSRSKNALNYTRRLWETTVKALLSRDFSLDGDIVNAFEGVSKTMRPELGSFHYGLPENNFDRALLWHTNAVYPIARRPGFPSWSWAGWMHREQTGLLRVWVYDAYNTSVVTYHHLNEAGEAVQICRGQEQVLMNIDPEIRAHFECPTIPILDTRNLEPRDHFLIFWTSSAIIPLLRLGPHRYVAGGGRYSEAVYSHIFALSDEWYAKQQKGVEFIVISSNYNQLEVMIIEWVDGIAYRVQVPGSNTERFPQEFWHSAKPQRKLIVLG
ncbi:hypothetical protein B7494_g294 [Chlorociboria aeruginascens]|nr:hypothetical protein B7494_g294 [Chlorociboria aeruginascens]